MNTTTLPDSQTVKDAVRRHYSSVAQGLPGTSSDACCNTELANASCGCTADAQAQKLGYSSSEVAAVPAGSNLGLGCGNPVAIASLKTGQTVLDLGSGAGFDAFLAARAVGPTGKVIGVDMTSEMISKARANAAKGGYTHVEFRLGEIEQLPVADDSVDVIISNCVINLCPDKTPVYREAFRVLKPGGRLAVSDVVARAELPLEAKRNLELHASCLSGATLQTTLLRILEEAGFKDVVIRPRGNSDEVITSWDVKQGFEQNVFAAEILATKPSAPCCGPTCCS
jgi:SAM-dependent methyltransferase